MTALERGEAPSGQQAPSVHVAQPAAPRPDVLLVTVNEHETRAVHDAFEQATGQVAVPVPLGGRVYRNLGEVNGTTVFHALSEMGSSSVGAMQQTVDKAIRALDPGAVIAVGIAFGVNEKKQAIGEILLSKQLRPYDLQRVGSKGEVKLRGDKPHATPRLIDHFDGFRQTAWDGAKVTPGVLLTGERLIDDIDYRDSLIAIETEAIGGEMEGVGLYVTCYEHKVDWVVIKAICDWADGNKGVNKKRRQKKAAKNSAEFVLKALQYAPLKRP
jgi:nucleoside phosphorylase